MTTWQQAQTAAVGQQVKALRGENTAVWLSEKTEQAGMKVSRSAISELESGKRRSISVAELLILAAALEVPPALLLFPNYPHGHVEPLPDVTTTSFDAVQWLDGRARLTGHPNVEYIPRAHELVSLAEERARLNYAFASLLERKNDPDWIDKVFELIEHTDKRRDELDEQIRRAGGVVDDG